MFRVGAGWQSCLMPIIFTPYFDIRVCAMDSVLLLLDQADTYLFSGWLLGPSNASLISTRPFALAAINGGATASC
jgi:hypothetical protein